MPIRLEQVRRRFEQKIVAASDFVSRGISARHPSQQRNVFTKDHVEWIYEVSLLKIMVASEEFFEDTLGLYVLGERTPSGYRPRRRRNIQVSLTQVLEIFRGDENFVGWNDPGTMIARAEKWLRDGEPFRTALGGAGQLMGYLRTMRNVIAHESEHAQEKFVKATRLLYGSVPADLTPGKQLMATPPPGIPYLTGSSLFEAATIAYRAVASQVVR